MKTALWLVIMAIVISSAYAAPVKITAPGEAYGHHGMCGGWNACGTAETCALKACQANGYDVLISYGEAKPCTEFGMCHLFNNIDFNTETYASSALDCNWGTGCAVSGVTDIVCDDGTARGQCEWTPIPDDGDDSVPEFTAIGAGIALVGAGIVAARRRKD